MQTFDQIFVLIYKICYYTSLLYCLVQLIINRFVTFRCDCVYNNQLYNCCSTTLCICVYFAWCKLCG